MKRIRIRTNEQGIAMLMVRILRRFRSNEWLSEKRKEISKTAFASHPRGPKVSAYSSSKAAWQSTLRVSLKESEFFSKTAFASDPEGSKLSAHHLRMVVEIVQQAIWFAPGFPGVVFDN